MAQKYAQEEGIVIAEAVNAKVDTLDDAVKLMHYGVVETMIEFVLVGKQASIVQFFVKKILCPKIFQKFVLCVLVQEMESVSKMVGGAKTKPNVNVTRVTRGQTANVANQEIAKRTVSIALVIQRITPKCVLDMVLAIVKVEETDKNAR